MLFRKNLLRRAVVIALCAVPSSDLLAQAPGPDSINFAQLGVAGALVATGEINGVVTDGSRGIYLIGAEVRLSGFNVVAVTNSEGRFTLRSVPVGDYTLEVRYLGLPARQLSVTVQEQQKASVTVALGATGSSDDAIESIAVVGTRPQAESEARALQMQRASAAIINVVSADAVGQFPDQNIAAALSRLPGIAVERDQGQERSISMRGAPSRWSSISFDG